MQRHGIQRRLREVTGGTEAGSANLEDMAVDPRNLGYLDPAPKWGTPGRRGSSALRHVLLGLDTLAVASAWGAVELVTAGSAFSVGLAVARVGLISFVSLLLVVTQRLHKARVCAQR